MLEKVAAKPPQIDNTLGVRVPPVPLVAGGGMRAEWTPHRGGVI